jgi:hypothetical protein
MGLGNASVDAVAAVGLVEDNVLDDGARAAAVHIVELDKDGALLALLERSGGSADSHGGEEEGDDAGELHDCGWSLVDWLGSGKLV